MAQLLEILKKSGTVRPRDLKTFGIPQEYLHRLYQQGRLIRTSRGVYAFRDQEVSEHHSLVQVCKQVPKGIVCLLSALRFHDITTQAPFEVWIAIGQKARRPKVVYPKLRLMHFSGAALISGIEHHEIEGVDVKIYTPAKTVADCFKYRNKIGLDVALEALRECRRGQHCTMDDLWQYARICRVANVMRPYLESLQ